MSQLSFLRAKKLNAGFHYSVQSCTTFKLRTDFRKKGRVHLPQLLLISSSLFKTASLLPKTGPCHFQGFSTPHGLGKELSLAISTVYWVTCSVAVRACHLPEKTEPCTPIPSCLQSQFPPLSKCRLRNRYIKRKGLLRSALSQKKALKSWLPAHPSPACIQSAHITGPKWIQSSISEH